MQDAAARRSRLWTRADVLVVVLLLVLAVAVSALTIGREAGSRAVVVVAGQRSAVLPLEATTRITVQGPLGPTVVEGTGHAVHVVSSACPQNVCVRMGEVSAVGETILCVPNRVVVRVEGDTGDQGVDGVVG